MRTTLTIDDDVLVAVQELARRERTTAGRVLSELARQALTAPPAHEPGDATLSGAPPGFRPLSHRGAAVSNKLIDHLREEESA